MLNKVNIEKILFLDIETVPQTYIYQDLDEDSAYHFGNKTKFFWQNKTKLAEVNGEEMEVEMLPEDVYDRAGIYAEFGKIVCISCGFVKNTATGKQIRMKSFDHDDEETLLRQFSEMLMEHFSSPYHLLCGHNAKEFDFPFIARRMLILGIPLPPPLDIAGKKPWEVNHLDTMELWKFGDYKHYTTLALLCHIFGIPTPKDDISGADVARVYYEEEDVARISRYCEKDVVALIQLFLKMKGDALVEEGDIHYSRK